MGLVSRAGLGRNVNKPTPSYSKYPCLLRCISLSVLLITILAGEKILIFLDS
jgi:hypothetical protein